MVSPQFAGEESIGAMFSGDAMSSKAFGGRSITAEVRVTAHTISLNWNYLGYTGNTGLTT